VRGVLLVLICMLPVLIFTFFTVLSISKQIGCRFWDLALREHASTNKVTVTAILPLLEFKPHVEFKSWNLM